MLRKIIIFDFFLPARLRVALLAGILIFGFFGFIGCGSSGGTTSPSADTTAPTISSVFPTDGATGVSTTTAVSAIFSEVMDSDSITTSSFSLVSSTGSVTGSVSYTSSTKTATFTPVASLSYNTTYTATISADVTDSAGNGVSVSSVSLKSAASNYTWTFTTTTEPDTTAPTVSSVSPTNESTDIAITSAVSATFSETMGSSSLNTSSFTLSSAIGAVTGSVTYEATSKTATFTPASSLAYSTTYRATVAASAADEAGNTLALAETWTFTTTAEPDTTAPSTVNLSLLANNTSTNDATPTFVWNAATDASGIVSYEVVIDTTSAVVGNVTSYIPTVNIVDGNHIWKVRAKDGAGNWGSYSSIWTFSIDTTAPSISLVSPTDEATGVVINPNVTVVFSESMDSTTINDTNFTLSSSSGQITGTVTYDAVSKTATFTVSSNLTYATEYTASMAAGVKDVVGNQMGTASTWSFTTLSAPSVSGEVTYPEGSDASIAGVVVTLEGSSTQTTTTDANGAYSFTVVSAESHTVSFYKTGWTFTPSVESFSVLNSNVTKNATCEITGFVKVASGTTNDLFTVDYEESQGSVGGADSSPPVFLWYEDGSFSMPSATGLPDDEEIVCTIQDGADSAKIVLEDGPIYTTSDRGQSFSTSADLSTGNEVLGVRDASSTGDPAFYVLGPGVLQYTPNSGNSYVDIILPLSATNINAIYTNNEPRDNSDYNLDGDKQDTVLWLVGDNGIVYYSCGGAGGGNPSQTQVDSLTSDSFSGIAVDIFDGLAMGYLVTDTGGLYYIEGSIVTGDITMTEVFSGAPYTFNAVFYGDTILSEPSFIVGNDGVILQSR
jgi:hypothetical protein